MVFFPALCLLFRREILPIFSQFFCPFYGITLGSLPLSSVQAPLFGERPLLIFCASPTKLKVFLHHFGNLLRYFP